MLASMLANDNDLLRADFQQYYNLNIDGMGREYTFAHAAVLCANLPFESRIVRKHEPQAQLNMLERLGVLIEHRTRLISWQMGGGKGNKPKPLIDMREKPEQEEYKALSIDEIDAILKANR